MLIIKPLHFVVKSENLKVFNKAKRNTNHDTFSSFEIINSLHWNQIEFLMDA